MDLLTPLKPDLQAVVLDLDGTLVDTLADTDATLQGVMDELGLPRVSRAFIERTVGKGFDFLLRQCLAEVGQGTQRLAAARQAYLRHYRQCNGRYSSVYPGVRVGLDGLRRRGLKLACLTNKPGEFASALLERMALAPSFDRIFGGDAFERLKPDPLPLLRTCEALGSLPHRTLMVGDSSNDARAARSAGCPVVLVSYGYNHGQPVAESLADRVIDRLDALLRDTNGGG